MRLSKPVYRSLQACRGLSDDEADRLTREVYRRNPKLAFYPVLAGLILIPIADLSPRCLETWLKVEKPWSLIIAGAVFAIPMILFESKVHCPAVNRAMLRLLAEQKPEVFGAMTRKSKKYIVAAAAALLIAAAAAVLPTFIRARATSASNTCVNNLRQTDGAEQQWMLENNKTTNDILS